MKSDSSTCSRESEDSDLDLKERKDIDACGVMTSTSTLTRSTQNDSEKKTTTQVTLGESIQKKYPLMISFVEDFHAKRLVLRARGKVSKTLVERYSSRYAELRNITDLACYSSKTSKAYLAMMEAEPSQQSSTLWKNWGTGGNTRFLTANISGSPRIEKEFLSLDILEKDAPAQYFLSQNAIKYLIKRKKENQKAGRGFGAVFFRQSMQDMDLLETQERHI